MADALWMRIREVSWDEFPAAGGANVPSLLKNLASRKLPRALKASHQTWTALCAGGEVFPAALPALPFLVEITTISDPAVQEGILDILLRLVTEGEEWQRAVQSHQLRLAPLRRSSDAVVAEKAHTLFQSW